MRRRSIALTASAGIAAGALGLTSLALPAGAQNPRLPTTTPQELVASVLESGRAPAMAGTVTVHNRLGLPALPGTEEAGEFLSGGQKSLRVWSDGERGYRMSVPTSQGEVTVVDDGNTVWKWTSSERTVVKHHTGEGEPGTRRDDTPAENPAELARGLVGKLRDSSEVTVDGTTRVAGEDAYELVLTPDPGERTKLREVRVAVGAEHRIPLRVEVNTNGSGEPALSAGFTRLDFGRQDPELFQFTPPENARVRTADPEEGNHPEGEQRQRANSTSRLVGDGWDTVVVSELPRQATRQEDTAEREHAGSPENPRGILDTIGEPISGSWGHGRVVDTAAGTAVITTDGRVAAGAVPRQVLTEALRNS
ncbi:LolA family protein [Actinopolyspora mortivallis]|uniref:LolA family protein n=1 Tax=Actinopolyspora mortivallis TaxID=33906 RepID=UPI00037519E8|nr:hypothetical protein [Actinopolyspora mortivallis]